MSTLENFKKTEEEKGQKHRMEEIHLVQTQWIPDIENMIPNVLDAYEKKNFEAELLQIKTELAILENANFEEEETLKQAKTLYKHSEGLFGKVSLCFEKEKDSV